MHGANRHLAAVLQQLCNKQCLLLQPQTHHTAPFTLDSTLLQNPPPHALNPA
jgi:hypothetical protein